MGRPLGHQYAPVTRSLARVTVPLPLDLFQDLSEVVARWILHRRERDVGFELLEPQQLADGQHVPVVEGGGAGGGPGAPLTPFRPSPRPPPPPPRVPQGVSQL